MLNAKQAIHIPFLSICGMSRGLKAPSHTKEKHEIGTNYYEMPSNAVFLHQ
jgi:hypothetical protein